MIKKPEAVTNTNSANMPGQASTSTHAQTPSHANPLQLPSEQLLLLLLLVLLVVLEVLVVLVVLAVLVVPVVLVVLVVLVVPVVLVVLVVPCSTM